MGTRLLSSSPNRRRLGYPIALIVFLTVAHSKVLAGQTKGDRKQNNDLALKSLEAEVEKKCSGDDIEDALNERGEIAPPFVRAVSTWKIPAGKTRAQVLQPALDCVTADWRRARMTLTAALEEKEPLDRAAHDRATAEARDRYLILSSVQASMKLLLGDADLYDLKVRAYAATVFSNLFRETPDDGYFAHSKPYFLLELAQTVTADRSLDTFASIAFKGTAAVTGNTAFEAVQQANTISGEVRVAFWPNILPSPIAGTTDYGQIGVGVGVTGGFIGIPKEDPDTHKTTTGNFEGLFRASLLIRELSGKWEGSFTELAFARDPRFDKRSRFYARGRLVLSSMNPDVKSHGIGGFIEGSINTRFSREDPDEARITVGVVLPFDAILESIFPSPKTDPAPRKE